MVQLTPERLADAVREAGAALSEALEAYEVVTGRRTPSEQALAEDGAHYQLGFEKWHNLEPGLLGEPLTDERNVAPGWQIQPTSRGLLAWVEQHGHAFVQHDGRVWRWQEKWSASREVPR